MDFAQAISDQVIYFEGGRAVESGTASEVFSHPNAAARRAPSWTASTTGAPARRRDRPGGERTSLMLRLVAGRRAVRSLVLVRARCSPQSALERVRASGRLRVGIDATYPPFGIAEGGDFSGFDVDIARAIARELRRRGRARQRQLRRRLPRAAERQLRRRHLGGDDHAGAQRDDAVLGSVHRRRAADRRARRQPDRRPRRPGGPHRRRADQHHRAVRDGEAARRDASRSTTPSTSRCSICRTGASTRWPATDRCCAT